MVDDSAGGTTDDTDGRDATLHMFLAQLRAMLKDKERRDDDRPRALHFEIKAEELRALIRESALKLTKRAAGIEAAVDQAKATNSPRVLAVLLGEHAHILEARDARDRIADLCEGLRRQAHAMNFAADHVPDRVFAVSFEQLAYLTDLGERERCYVPRLRGGAPDTLFGLQGDANLVANL